MAQDFVKNQLRDFVLSYIGSVEAVQAIRENDSLLAILHICYPAINEKAKRFKNDLLPVFILYEQV